MRVHFYCDWILRVRSTESEEAAEEQASERSGAESAQSRCSLVLVTRAEYEGAVYPYRILALRLALRGRASRAAATRSFSLVATSALGARFSFSLGAGLRR